MQFNTDGIILKVSQTGEADRILTILTREYGIIRAFAKGAKRPKNRLHASTAKFAYSNLSIYKRKDTYNVNEAEIIDIFFGLRDNINKLSLADYFSEISNHLSPEGDTAEEQLRLLLNSLYMLEKDKRHELMLKAIMELRLLSLAGYMPNIVGCDVCGTHETQKMYFSIEEAKIFCSNCPPKIKTISLPLCVISAMRHIVFSELNLIYNFSLNNDNFKTLSNVTEDFFIACTSLPLPTLNFFKSLI